MTSDRIEREASDWFARLRGPDGEAEREAFERWRDADPRHTQAFAEYEKLWAAYGTVRRPREARPAPRPQWSWPALAAASIAIVLAIAIGVWRFGGAEPAPVGPPLVAFEATDAKALRLDDGSVVLLAPGATVAVAYSGEAREVRLTGGEARFVVAHDASRPFRVLAGTCSVLATGTVFDVRLAGGDADVALIEGRVEVHPGHGRPIRLIAGEGVGADGLRRPAAIPQRWTPPRVSVEAMPLRDVLALANRGTSAPIELGDATLGDRQVTGTFDLADTRALARKLAAALDLSLDESGSRLVLAGPR
ncbi:FecR domain-containing protein [Sphingomonas sp.]|uniref:FecR family protein n=1 Tax=Sphingomonas sp. TaxID=28214 RepID=UPI001B253349|nr:FecR domain-containing protein [Sphingomonas sp.]MBO9712496.1 FecR domain-containing protein [Sphingomonas sp.]